MAEEKKSFGEFLVGLGVLTPDQLKRTSQEQKQRGERLEQTAIRLGYAKEELILQCLADYSNLPYVDLDTYLIDENIVKTIPEELARRHTLIPLFKIGNTLTVAMPNPLNLLALDEVKNRVKSDVEIAIGTEKKIKKAIEQHYGAAAAVIESAVQRMVESSAGGLVQESADYRKTYDLVVKDLPTGPLEDASAARMLDLVMMQAIRDRASDIHFEPDEKGFRVRLRIDGFLYESLTLPKHIQPAVTSRIKILAEMDIAETRLPQDGNFNVKLERRGFEIRVSTFPTIHGENVVLRILDQTSPLFKLEQLGFSDDTLNQFKQLVRKTNGIILVTGPTGSGKTTTLYALLNMINSKDKNIITIEDPVEYRLALIRQTQINPKAGITFATGLRSILRQDPDIIMIGEIRDLETSEIAMQAALTGHLVLSTLHTNDAPEAISRLVDIGVEPYLISSCVIGVLAQRLVRTICPDCKVPYQVDPKNMSDFGVEMTVLKEPLTLYLGKGCKNCKQSGYRGRTGIYELVLVNEEIKKLISERAAVQVIREVAKKTAGMVSLRGDGLRKVLKGITTFEEVNRVAY
jgi:type IV pilus assembly protein PilB